MVERFHKTLAGWNRQYSSKEEIMSLIKNTLLLHVTFNYPYVGGQKVREVAMRFPLEAFKYHLVD